MFHIILADVRGFGLTGGDYWDYRGIAFGPAGLTGQGPWGLQYVNAADAPK